MKDCKLNLESSIIDYIITLQNIDLFSIKLLEKLATAQSNLTKSINQNSDFSDNKKSKKKLIDKSKGKEHDTPNSNSIGNRNTLKKRNGSRKQFTKLISRQ